MPIGCFSRSVVEEKKTLQQSKKWETKTQSVAVAVVRTSTNVQQAAAFSKQASSHDKRNVEMETSRRLGVVPSLFAEATTKAS